MRRLVIFLCLMISACSAGSGEGLDVSGRPIGETPVPNDQPTFSNIQARIFTPICTQCHVGAAAPQGLRLDSANSYGDLVGVPSREVPALDRVEPFDPGTSYMFQKISGTAAVGGRMPLGGPSLPDEDIELVRQWISDGASPTPISFQPIISKVLVASISQFDDAQIVRITVSRELDATSILKSSFRIIKSANAQFGNSDDSEIVDFTVDMGFPEGRRSHMATLLEGNWKIRKGLNAKLSYEYFDPDDTLDEDQRNRISAVLEFFPIQFTQLRLGARYYNGIPQNPVQNRTDLFLQVHVFF